MKGEQIVVCPRILLTLAQDRLLTKVEAAQLLLHLRTAFASLEDLADGQVGQVF